MKLLALIFLAITGGVCAAAAPQFTDVYKAGEGGYPAIRIPSLVVTRQGALLAIAEGRAFARADQAKNKIILKRSRDRGRTWDALQIIAEDGTNCLNNPCSVVDQKTGRVIVMFQSYPADHHEGDRSIKTGLTGADIVRNKVITSDDGGVSWSQMEDVTRTTKHPTGVTIMASGPGTGIQLERDKKHKGRILIPFNEGPFGKWNVLAVYSDNHGRSWHLGEPAPGCCVTNAAGKVTSLVNEVQMVELSDGTVMLNSRKWGGKALRKTAVSRDGGKTWSAIGEDDALRDPGCMASVFSTTDAAGRNVLLYSGPDSAHRDTGTVRLSRDDGKTWPTQQVLYPGSFAYSVLARLPDGDLGCLFETDKTDRMVFARFSWEWLEGDSTEAATE